MSSTDDFDREVKALVTRGKLSSSAVASLSDLAMANIRADSQLVSTLYRHHRKASPANKLVSLYLIDAIAREAKSRQKKAEREDKGKAPAAGSTTPLDSPPEAGPSAGNGDFATFLRKLEAVLSKIVLDNWENGLPEHREKVRKVLDIWTKASTFSASALARISTKLLATSTAIPTNRQSPGRPSLSPGPADTPPLETANSQPGGAIPASVLALLQAKTAPSQAALEQQKHSDVESEVERALREAREGASSILTPVPTSSNPAVPSQPAYLATQSGSSYGAPPHGFSAQPATSRPPHHQAPYGGSASSSLNAGPPAYSAQQPPPSQAHSPPNGAGQAFGSFPAQGQQQGPTTHRRQDSHNWSGGDRYNSTSDATRGPQGAPSFAAGPSNAPRGQTRPHDAVEQSTPGSGYGQRDEPPNKRPYQPEGTAPVAPTSYQTGLPVPAQVAPIHGAHPAHPAATPFDPTTFDATSPASWSAFVDALKIAHPYFATIGRPPTMEEVMGMCAPSAMMAFGSAAGSTGGPAGMAMGQGTVMGQGMAMGSGAPVGQGNSYQAGLGQSQPF